jgi:hypothetical protein
MKLDPGKLTFGEIIEIEEKSGVEFSTVLNGGVPPTKALAALVWVLLRRDQPDLTWDDALKLELNSADDLFVDEVSSNGAAVDPTPPTVANVVSA